VLSIFGVLLVLAVIGGAVLPAGASAAECTDTFRPFKQNPDPNKPPIEVSEGTWQSGEFWTSGLPTESDVACIRSGKTAVLSAGSRSVGAVQGEGTLKIASGELQVMSNSATSGIKSVTLEGGTIGGPGTLEVTGALTWTAGTMTGSGTTVLAPGATGTLTNALLEERTFVNEGTLTFGSGIFQLSDAAHLRNKGIFRANSTTAASPQIRVAPESAAEPRIVNLGTIAKTSGLSRTSIGVDLENEAAINAESGTIAFVAGSEVVLDGGSTTKGPVAFAGAHVVAHGLHAGSLRLETGTFTIAEGPTSTVGELILEVASANLGGPGTLEVTGALTWTAGTMTGSGTTVLAPGATGTLTNALLEERTFVNEGTLTFGSGIFQLSDAAHLRNKGIFRANSTTAASPQIRVAPESAAEPRIVNLGTIAKTSGLGTTTVGVSYEEFGRQNIETGRLDFLFPALVAANTGTPGHCEEVDPVDCATGNFTETQTDFEIGGRGAGLVLARTYSAQAAAAGSLGIFGYGWTNSFGDTLIAEEGGAKETLANALGKTFTFTKSGASWTAPSWSRDALTGSAETGFTLTLPGQTQEGFSGSGRLVSVTDRNGNETTLAYNGSGQIDTITDPTGRSISLVYNGEGLVEEATDPMGHVVKYTYESKQLKSVTLPGEAAPNWQFDYDSSRRMTAFTDGRGGETTNEYDSSNRVIAQTDPAERKTTFVYEPFHTVITNKATGAVKDEWFNSDNQPTSVTRGFGTKAATTTTFSYTEAGLLAAETDGNGHTTTYGYDAEGNRTSETDAEGDETRWTFDAAHQVVSETTPTGEKTTIERNANGEPETITRPAPGAETQEVSYEYGPHGEVKSMTDALGATWTYGYDEYGDRTSETDPEADEQTWGYD
jgi:YD repeat-containing protein